ncbi:hypothetical protein E2C01_024214 [Portunus trituberculatus]|uniref:Uncharacterized protein n=1 Tax=Portunus trituberculatus TaxID=210409 RepID=A0A5B7EA28_PORTR|nr:hypothetical protein [Portunus trituberculatus]
MYENKGSCKKPPELHSSVLLSPPRPSTPASLSLSPSGSTITRSRYRRLMTLLRLISAPASSLQQLQLSFKVRQSHKLVPIDSFNCSYSLRRLRGHP